MKKLVALFALLMCVVPVYASGPPPKPIDVIHHVSGEGKIIISQNDEITFQFDATDMYGNVTGTARFSSASGYGFTMYVDCISVVGHTAWVSGALTSGTYPLFPGQSAVFQIVDGSPDQLTRPITGQNSPCTDQAQHALYTVVGNISII